MRKHIVLPRTRLAAQAKHARATSLCGRLLRDQRFWQDKVELGDEHLLILFRRGCGSSEVRLCQGTQTLECLFGGEACGLLLLRRMGRGYWLSPHDYDTREGPGDQQSIPGTQHPGSLGQEVERVNRQPA